MKNKRLNTIVSVTYTVVFVLFLAFAVYMGLCEHNSVYSTRKVDPCESVKSYTENTVEDESAPIGIRRVYSFNLSGITPTKDHLAFYTIHSFAEVRIDGQTVYSLSPGEKNRLGSSPSCNWVFVPLYMADNGKTVEITVTPVYQSVADREVSFLLGTRSEILLRQFRDDLPQIVPSVVCIFLGIILTVIMPVLIVGKKTDSRSLFYLGNFLLLIGLWRITDTRFSPILFPENTMALGYITIASLFLCCIPLLLFFREYCSERGKRILNATAFLACIVAFGAFICQVFKIADLRETMFASHIMFIIIMVTVLFVSVSHLFSREDKNGLHGLVLFLSPGVAFDLVSFYLNKSSSGAMFTILALLLYSFIRLVTEIFSINKKIHTDPLTGLFNRDRWNITIKKSSLNSAPTGIIMMDINRLKYTNDTMGHDVGDMLILSFADILRSVLPSDCTVFRWGGDEFVVLVSNAYREKMDGYISKISEAAERHNSSGKKPEIHFSAGYAVSGDYPALSPEELLAKADEKMYYNKDEWYRKNFAKVK